MMSFFIMLIDSITCIENDIMYVDNWKLGVFKVYIICVLNL